LSLGLAAGRWFSPGTPVSSTNKTDRHDIAEILLKVALNTIKLKTNLTADDNSYHWEGSRGKDVLIGRSQN
jgi:hypothetical protein